jgi:alpha-methylacyl-CoA racemase
MSGPLTGRRFIEVGGIGPAPFCGMMLSDMGAEVIRVERCDAAPGSPPSMDPLLRGRKSIALDLKQADGVEALLRLADQSDALYEGFRPGVAERLGIGPDTCLARNPKLVYGRMTGWGQQGPLARVAGHDINYIALSGALHAIGTMDGKPVPPLNLVGDFGGGGMLLAFGMLCALLEVQRSGRGQVVDAAMVDGALAQMSLSFGMLAAGQYPDGPGRSPLSGAMPFYDTYETADGRFVAIGSLEPQFFRLLMESTGIPAEDFKDAGVASLSDLPALTRGVNSAKWPEMRRLLQRAFRDKTRAEWCEIMEGTEVCFAPVLSLAEVADHHHIKARNSVIEIEGVPQNAPAPRFSVTQPGKPKPPPHRGQNTDELLALAGYSGAEIHSLRQQGAAG